MHNQWPKAKASCDITNLVYTRRNEDLTAPLALDNCLRAMLEHLLDIKPPAAAHSKKAIQPLDKANAQDVLDAQVNTTMWLESMGIEDDQKILADAEVAAARKVFGDLATVVPDEQTKGNLIALKTPQAVRHLVTMLSAYDWEFVEQAKNLRGMAVAKIIEETNHPDARIRLKALEMLGKVTEVGLFTEKLEIKKAALSDNEIEQRIKDKLNKFMQVVDVIDIEESPDDTQI